MTTVVVIENPKYTVEIFSVDKTETIVAEQTDLQIVEIVSVGPQGPPGSSVDPDSYFQVVNRFYEIAEDETAKATARENLGLATIDGGTFN